MSRRMFNVLMYVNGQGPKIQDHIESYNHSDLLRAIQRIVGHTIDFVAYFNKAKNCFLPLRPFDYDTLPEYLELHVTTAGHGGSATGNSPVAFHNGNGFCPDCSSPNTAFCTTTGRPHKLTDMPVMQTNRAMPLKARVIQILRDYFLPNYNTGEMTKEQLVATCSSVCAQFMRNHGLTEFEQQNDRRELTERERESLHQLVTDYLHAARPSDTTRPFLGHSGGGSPPRRSASPKGARTQGDKILFTSVSYAVGGEFPLTSRYNYQQEMRVTLSTPSNPDPNVDINVMGSVTAQEPVTLRWTLAYGPQRTVLNLDKLYTGGFVTTYQLNDTSLFLCLRPGSLVCGWEYHVHLTATNMNGLSGSAMVTFALPMPTGRKSLTRNPPMGIASPRQHTQPPPRGALADGYTGDTENRPLSPRRHDAAMVAPAFQARNDLIPPPTNTSPYRDPSHAGRGSYHEALKDFLETQVQPLYFLSANPSITEDQFRVIVKDVARTFWFSYPPEQPLTEDIKRTIVQRVKDGITTSKT